MRELNRCPDCGRKMKIDYKLKPLRYAVRHESNFCFSERCYGGTDFNYSSEEEAMTAWNSFLT